jgi:tetratricopeptide repeat protein
VIRFGSFDCNARRKVRPVLVVLVSGAGLMAACSAPPASKTVPPRATNSSSPGVSWRGQAPRSASDAPQAQLESRYELGAAAYSDGDHARAIELLTEAIDLKDQPVLARHKRALANLRLGRPQQALEDYEAVLRLRPDLKSPAFASALLARAAKSVAAEDDEQAEIDYAHAIELAPELAGDPVFAEALLHRGFLRLSANRRKAAVRDYVKSLGLCPPLKSRQGFPAKLAASASSRENLELLGSLLRELAPSDSVLLAPLLETAKLQRSSQLVKEATQLLDKGKLAPAKSLLREASKVKSTLETRTALARLGKAEKCVRYESARSALAAGRLTEAKAQFGALGSFKDAAAKARLIDQTLAQRRTEAEKRAAKAIAEQSKHERELEARRTKKRLERERKARRELLAKLRAEATAPEEVAGWRNAASLRSRASKLRRFLSKRVDPLLRAESQELTSYHLQLEARLAILASSDQQAARGDLKARTYLMAIGEIVETIKALEKKKKSLEDQIFSIEELASHFERRLEAGHVVGDSEATRLAVLLEESEREEKDSLSFAVEQATQSEAAGAYFEAHFGAR